VTARSVYARTLHTYRIHAGYLLILGAAVFVPLGLIDALADRLTEIDPEEIEELSDIAAVGAAAGFVVQVITSILGEVFYAGAVALALAGGVEAKPSSLRSVARRLAYWRLILVDLLFVLGSAIGLALLIVPGIVFFTWFALAGPVVELEGAGVKTAFARSRQLVRGHFWVVLLVLLPIALMSELLATGVVTGLHELIHSPLLSDWIGESLTGTILNPFYAVAAVIITLRLSRGDEPAGVSPSRAAPS
jgi:hypothetical protein